jgi:hypothetical protein
MKSREMRKAKSEEEKAGHFGKRDSTDSTPPKLKDRLYGKIYEISFKKRRVLMKRIALMTALLALTFTQYAFALGTPDFSGRWVLDSAEGTGAHAGADFAKGKVTIVIKQTKTTFSVDRKTGNRIETAVHKLDGTESINRLPSGKEKKSTSAWVGSTLVIKSKTDMSNLMGKMKVLSTEVFSLSPDGKGMTIETTIHSPTGETNQKLTYRKQ